jgi:hypothetical protein
LAENATLDARGADVGAMSHKATVCAACRDCVAAGNKRRNEQPLVETSTHTSPSLEGLASLQYKHACLVSYFSTY